MGLVVLALCGPTLNNQKTGSSPVSGLSTSIAATLEWPLFATLSWVSTLALADVMAFPFFPLAWYGWEIQFAVVNPGFRFSSV